MSPWGSIVNTEDWVSKARCVEVDADIFFPEKGQSGTAREAKQICGTCEVADQCLDYALRNGEPFGVWGGHTERERRRHNGKTHCVCGTELSKRQQTFCSEDCRRREWRKVS